MSQTAVLFFEGSYSLSSNNIYDTWHKCSEWGKAFYNQNYADRGNSYMLFLSPAYQGPGLLSHIPACLDPVSFLSMERWGPLLLLKDEFFFREYLQHGVHRICL